MKTIDEFLSYFQSLDVRFWVDGEQLHYNAPEGVLTPTLKSQLRERKSEIIEFLQKTDCVSSFSIKSILSVPRETDLLLSFSQQRLWFLQQLEPDNPFYNEHRALQLTGSLDVAALEQSLSEIVQRHETLRTTFKMIEGQPVQIIAPNLTLTLPVIDLCQVSEAEQKREVQRLATEQNQRPFDLVQGPLLRSTLLQLSEQEYVLLFTIHHIVGDGWSVGVFIRELSTLYQDFFNKKPPSLPELPIQYADFAVWERQQLQGKKLESQLCYWKQQLNNAPPLLQLPTDRPRPPVQTYRGTKQSFLLPKNLTEALKVVAQKVQATLFMTLLSAFNVLLYRYTGQEDIMLGSPTANRNRVEIEGLIGCFVNTLVLRTDVSGNPTFEELLVRVRKVMVEVYANQDLPFEKLVEELQPERHTNYNPLFQVSFALQNTPKVNFELPGLTITPFEIEDTKSLFDLHLDITETDLGLECFWEYNTDLFDAARISRMSGHFQTLLEAIVAHPQQRVDQLPLLSEAEKHQLLVEWNQTQASYPKDACIHQLFEAQVEKTPDAVAVLFEEQPLTYRELNQRANQLAHYLKKLGVKPEVLVGICVERSLEMVVGLLGILKAGGAYVPLDPAYPQERLAYMLSDSQVSVLLTTENLSKNLPEHQAHVIELDTDWELILQESWRNSLTEVKSENLAYVIYTSGSTGKPKGVMVVHKGLCNLAEELIRLFKVQSDSRVLQFISLSFDVSISEIAMALCSGATLCLGTSASLLPGQTLIQLLRDQAITHISLPSTVLAVLPTEKLPDLHTIIVGGEACSTELVAKWSKNRRFFNAYGPTESTVTATVYECTDASQKPPIGRPIANTQIYILDPQGQPVPIGVPGELHIGGVGLARGYLNRPELTAEKFIANPFDQTPSNPESNRLYKTGDLVRYLSDGNIEYLGRLDHQVKLRGFRIELGEIEAALIKHPAVQETLVLVREDNPGNKRLVTYVVPHLDSQDSQDQNFATQSQAEQISVAEAPEGKLIRQLAPQLRGFVKEILPDYMIPSAFVVLEALPLTPNGKIDRQALPAPDEDIIREHEYVAPRTPDEEIIANIFASVLGLQHVGIHDNFFALGGHSLLATQLISRLKVALDVEIPLRTVFESPTVVQFEQTLTQLGTTNSKLSLSPIQPRTHSEQLPLSWAQERLWFLNQLEGSSATYNIPGVLRITGNFDLNAFEQALSEIVRRHEILRTSFPNVNGTPIQVIDPEATMNINVVDLQKLEVTERETALKQQAQLEAITPFDLEIAPLIRCNLLHLDATEYLLLLTMHHIVSDGWSIGVFIQELSTLYQAFVAGEPSPLAELPIQYADFAMWQKQWLGGEVLQNQLNYWKQQLYGVPELLQLPTDRPRPSVQTYRGAIQGFTLSANLTQKLQTLSRESGTTLFMTLLAAFATLLYRYTSQSDIVIGSPIANRNRSEIESLIGFFVNTLVLKTRFEENSSFENLLLQVRETTLKAYEHQEVPFEQVVEALQPQRSLSHSPLFQVMFILQNVPMGKVELPDVNWTQLVPESAIAKFDLTLLITETFQGLVGVWEYNTDLFDGSTIERMATHFQNLLSAIVENPQLSVTELPLLSEAERHQLLVEWNQTSADYQKDICIHQLFEAQVDKTPDAVAVVFEDQQLTYRELNQRANQLAYYLKKLGVQPEILVGICVERSLEMLVGLLGILKTGGAYVPLDPTYPQERLAYMLSDSQVSVLLTTENLSKKLPEHQAHVVELDTNWGLILQESWRNSLTQVTSENLAYVIYTSGSTGKPKGVLVTHKGLCNLAKEQIRLFNVQPGSRVLQFASLSFDASIWEIVMALCSGATLCLGKSASLLPGRDLMQLLRDQRITHVTVPPTALTVLPSEELPALHTIIVAGEAFSTELVAQWSQNRRFFNAYGPTESTVCATVYECRDINQKAPIGRPIANTQIYILDSEGQPVPIGVPGELHIGGVGLARGYLNRPELTAQKFISNPFNNKLGNRLYKTGDLCCYLPNGNIKFLGRMDHQVKIRGFRIELGEIEAALLQHPATSKVVVLVREDHPEDKRIVAYLVFNQEQVPAINQLQNFLKEKLANYMMPSAFVVLEALPLTANGKVDRHALPVPEGRPDLEEAYVMPKTEAERIIATVWQEILQIEKVGINDNFFSIGGHSLLIVKIQAKLNEILGKEISIIELFKYPTIKELAQYLIHKTDVDKTEVSYVGRIHKRASRQKEAIKKQKQLLRQKGRKANG